MCLRYFKRIVMTSSNHKRMPRNIISLYYNVSGNSCVKSTQSQPISCVTSGEKPASMDSRDMAGDSPNAAPKSILVISICSYDGGSKAIDGPGWAWRWGSASSGTACCWCWWGIAVVPACVVDQWKGDEDEAYSQNVIAGYQSPRKSFLANRYICCTIGGYRKNE